MQTRTIGKAGIDASIIRLGGKHLDNQPQSVVDEVISAALDSQST